MNQHAEIKRSSTNYTRAEVLASTVLSFLLTPMFFAGRKKILLDHDWIYTLYAVQEKTCKEVGDIVGHSEDLIYRTLKEIEKEKGKEILRNRNHKVYVNRRRYSTDFIKEKNPKINLRRPNI